MRTVKTAYHMSERQKIVMSVIIEENGENVETQFPLLLSMESRAAAKKALS